MTVPGGSPVDPNPYQPPRAPDDEGRRNLFVLAAVGAFLASLYWALVTALLAFGIAKGSMEGTALILPVVLVAMYASRGYRIWKGDADAARGILWLHGLGMVMAVIHMTSGAAQVAALHGVKIAIHIFGLITAYLAQRSR
ncbi:MAG TPA: hypothetical protein VN914_04665 [Polyangia bacterium]|nr:hypothetical protein [Polyangia bacterium]